MQMPPLSTRRTSLKEAADAAARRPPQQPRRKHRQRRGLQDMQVELLNAQGQTGKRGICSSSSISNADSRMRRRRSATITSKLLELQQLQRDQRAAQQLIDSTAGPSGSITAARAATTAVASSVTDRTALMLVDLTRTEVTLLTKIEANTRDGGSGGGRSVHVTFNFKKELTDEDFDAVKDRLLDVVNEGLGTSSLQATLRSGGVTR
jgi:hypothetical protein